MSTVVLGSRKKLKSRTKKNLPRTRKRRVGVNQASGFYRKNAVRGRGEYGDIMDPRAFRSENAGKHFENQYGSRLGSVIGEGLQGLASVFGFGEYNIQENSLMGQIDMGTSPPRVMNTSRGEATVFHHREYLGELISGPITTGTSTAFNLQTYAINPGNPLLFPFLAPISTNFQEWEARGILVEIKTETSDVVATGGFLGSMFAAVDYDALSPPPNNKIQLENMEYASSVKPSFSMIMPIECKRRNDVLSHLYTAVNSNYQGGDKRLYDLGTLYVGTQGLPQDQTPVAEIWITYEIAFYKPKVSDFLLLNDLFTHYSFSGCDTSLPFNGLQLLSVGSPSFNLFIQQSGFIIFPPVPGVWFLTMNWVGADALAMPTVASFTYSNCAAVSSTEFSSPTGASTVDRIQNSLTTSLEQSMTRVYTAIVTDANIAIGASTAQLTVSTMPTAPVYGDLIATYVPLNSQNLY